MTVKSIFITGATRGVGLAIAKKFAASGANIAFVAKTVEPHPKLKGTIASAKAEIIQAGANQVLSIGCDVRNLAELKAAIDEAGTTFGKLDLLVNNASSVFLLKTAELPEKRYDLMQEIIVRASLFASKYALPYLEKSSNPHIINLAPNPDIKTKWFKDHTAYTLCKFASSMIVVGLSAELKEKNIVVNGLWPATLLDTAAVQNLLGGADAVLKSRKPEIVADAAYFLAQYAISETGKFYLDEDIIIKHGLNPNSYNVNPNYNLIRDLYV